MTLQLHELVARALAGDPDAVALEFADAPVRWRYVRRIAAGLDAILDGAGFGVAGRIAFVPRNRPAFAAALLALIAARRSIQMVYAFQSPRALAGDLARLGPAAAIADAQDWTAETLAALPEGALAIALAADPADPDPVRVLRGDPAGVPAAIRSASDGPVIELLTSGTTGAPRRTPMPYATIAHGVIAGSVLGAGSAHAAIVNYPLSNISGLYSYLPIAVARQPVVLLEKFDLDRWLAYVARHRPSFVVLPPAGVRMMLDRAVPRDALAGVRHVSVGTAAVDPATHRAFERAYGVAILFSYGATEFCGAATTMTPALHERYGEAKFGSVGRPTGDNEVRIVDPADGRVLPPGEVGIVEVKVPFLGEDFIRTTDLGMLDGDGFLFHRGRADGVIVRGGFKIMPGAIERVIDACPGVSASCVVGVSERRLGQVPVAIVETVAGATPPSEAELGAALRATLPATSIPVAYRFVAALPRTPSLKIDLGTIRADAEARFGADAASAVHG